MSAFMVNDDTLDLLASVTIWDKSGIWLYAQPNVLPPRSDIRLADKGHGISYTRADANDIKRELQLENIASLWARYPDDGLNATPKPSPVQFIYDDQATIGQALGALSCYEYQACESENWYNSYAYALCQAIRKCLCSIIAEGWEYERPADLPKRVSLMDLI